MDRGAEPGLFEATATIDVTSSSRRADGSGKQGDYPFESESLGLGPR